MKQCDKKGTEKYPPKKTLKKKIKIGDDKNVSIKT